MLQKEQPKLKIKLIKIISKSILITLLYCTQITYAIIESNPLTESPLIHKMDSKKIRLNQNSPLTTINQANINSINTQNILTPHMKNYFILGTDKTRYGNQAKFQISVKLKLIPQSFYNSNLYFAYSQLTFLDYLITSNKKYTYESIIMPEIFIRKYFINHPFVKYMGIGIKHGSNGTGGSWGDRILVHSKFHFLTHWSALTEFWGKSFTMDPNKPMDPYLGNGKIILTGHYKYATLSATTYIGITKKIPFSREINLDIPLHKSLCLSIQYWNGHAETFYTERETNTEYFKRRTKRIRIGLSIPLNINNS